jgi:hypothetical protein
MHKGPCAKDIEVLCLVELQDASCVFTNQHGVDGAPFDRAHFFGQLKIDEIPGRCCE